MSLHFAFGLLLSTATLNPSVACHFDTDGVCSSRVSERVALSFDGTEVEASGMGPDAALPDPQLAAIRGTQLPMVGLDQVDAAMWATAISADVAGTPPSGLNRDLVDNWNFGVANVLILDGINQTRPM